MLFLFILYFHAETYVGHISYIFIAVIVYENESITTTHFIEKTNHNFNEKEDLITKKKKRFYFHKQLLRDISSSSIYICYLQNFLKEKKYVIAKYLQGLQRRLEVLSLVSYQYSFLNKNFHKKVK